MEDFAKARQDQDGNFMVPVQKHKTIEQYGPPRLISQPRIYMAIPRYMWTPWEATLLGPWVHSSPTMGPNSRDPTLESGSPRSSRKQRWGQTSAWPPPRYESFTPLTYFILNQSSASLSTTTWRTLVRQPRQNIWSQTLSKDQPWPLLCFASVVLS